eukprot:4245930-Pleurochrysis_carterae.AAC.2
MSHGPNVVDALRRRSALTKREDEERAALDELVRASCGVSASHARRSSCTSESSSMLEPNRARAMAASVRVASHPRLSGHARELATAAVTTCPRAHSRTSRIGRTPSSVP